MAEKLTKEEYIARAMLLGMEYSELVHCFIKETSTKTPDWFDADTMQQLSTVQKLKRIMDWAGEHPPAQKPGHILTWEGKPI